MYLPPRLPLHSRRPICYSQLQCPSTCHIALETQSDLWTSSILEAHFDANQKQCICKDGIPVLSAAPKAGIAVFGLQCVVCASDSSLDRVLALISKAALLGVDQQRLAQAQQACVSRNLSAASALQAALHASPFSMDTFRLHLLNARRLGLGHEVESSQGECPHTAHFQPAAPVHVACTKACSAWCFTLIYAFCETAACTTTNIVQDLPSAGVASVFILAGHVPCCQKRHEGTYVLESYKLH